MGFQNSDRPCPTCKGQGVVVLTSTAVKGGQKTTTTSEQTCPTCRGSKKSAGLGLK